MFVHKSCTAQAIYRVCNSNNVLDNVRLSFRFSVRATASMANISTQWRTWRATTSVATSICRTSWAQLTTLSHDYSASMTSWRTLITTRVTVRRRAMKLTMTPTCRRRHGRTTAIIWPSTPHTSYPACLTGRDLLMYHACASYLWQHHRYFEISQYTYANDGFDSST